MPHEKFSPQEADAVAATLGLDWNKEPFDLFQFTEGMNVELEHGTRSPETNVTNDDPVMTGKIALAHLREFADYYIRLEEMEHEAEEFWGKEKEGE